MKWIRYFILSAGVILLVAALTRFLIVADNAQVLASPEPLLGIPLRHAVLLVGGFELAVALICLFGKRTGLQLGWLAWLGTNYVVFWIGLVWQHYSPQGACIGSLTDPLHLTRGISGLVLQFIPVYLLLGSYAAVVWLWLEGRRAKAADFLKMSCPSCGVHLRFDGRNIGQNIPCPHCQTTIVLRKPDENLKMACVLCGGRIEFPPHAIGSKIPCPHCAKNITLLKPA
jgi:predicted RNA-binding Zn-ribbon protein involved in translation (DUF1610 family)